MFLYPYSINLLSIDNAYVGCPGSTLFCIQTEGASEFHIEIFNRDGEEIFDNSGLITPPITCIWDGTYKGGTAWPSDDPVDYELVLTNCLNSFTKTGSIEPHINCSGKTENKLSANNGNFDTTNVSLPYYKKLIVSPNPNSGAFTVAMDLEIRNGEIQIRDLLGNLVKSLKTSASSIEIVTQPKGVYFVKIISEQGEVLGVKKVVVQ